MKNLELSALATIDPSDLATATGGVNLGEVMQVTDLLKAAGVEHVGLEAEMPKEQ